MTLHIDFLKYFLCGYSKTNQSLKLHKLQAPPIPENKISFFPNYHNKSFKIVTTYVGSKEYYLLSMKELFPTTIMKPLKAIQLFFLSLCLISMQ